LTKELLKGLGLSSAEVKRVTETFMRLDEKRLYEDYQYYTDVEKVRANALSQAKELEELFAQDVAELPDEDGVAQKREPERVSVGSPDG
jgi:5'-deoxynucleotidase YfbR-like HD superfamily hydrolase